MEVLILIFLFVALFLIGSGKRSSSRPSYEGRRKPKLRSKKTQSVKQYEFNPKYFKPFEGKAHVIDGDTIVVKRQKIRLAGVNAPELDQAWGQKSKWEMVKILKGKVVKVVPNGETSYDRIVATCYIDGDKDIGAELISRGLARDIPAFTGGKYKEFETGAGRRRVKPTPYNNNATKHPSAPEDERKLHDGEVVKLKSDEAQIAQPEPQDDEISLVEKWDDVEIRMKPND